jgi:flavin reductase (DIM6/NTAB) family NADH-FMN oxidoreductase RutF/NifU-like protein involved in Fe-S cluster formation
VEKALEHGRCWKKGEPKMSDFMSIGSRTVPENFGPLRDANGNARQTGDCGDSMEFWIRVENKVIVDAGFMTDGDSVSVKIGSVAAVMCLGSSTETAGQITKADILGVAGLAEDKTTHCALLAAQTLKAAIEDFHKQSYSSRRSGEKTSAITKSVLNPKPSLLVSCRDSGGKNRIFVVTYAGNCSINPPSIMIGIVSSRSTMDIVKEAGSFIANIAPSYLKKEFHYLGTHAEIEDEKLQKVGLKTANGLKVNAPILTDCPVNIECTVTGSMNTGSHEMFIGKIEHVHADREIVNPDGSINWNMITLLH